MLKRVGFGTARGKGGGTARGEGGRAAEEGKEMTAKRRMEGKIL